MNEKTLIGPWVRRFLLEHMVSERNLSRNTQTSYRDTLTLLLPFAGEHSGCAIDRLTVEELTPAIVRKFLEHVESVRGCSGVTRNNRLATVHSLAKFIGMRSPLHIAWATEIRSIPFKKVAKNLIGYLERAEMDALLKSPDRRTELGDRDYTILLFLYNSGARADETAGLLIRDLHLKASPAVRIVGKGNKHRLCPLWPTTVSALSRLIAGRTAVLAISTVSRRSSKAQKETTFMLNQSTTEKLYVMRLRGMAEGFRAQQEQTNLQQLTFEERFTMLVDQQWNWRADRALERRLRNGRLQGQACIEEIDYRAVRGLDRQMVRSLVQDSDWVRRHQQVFVVGPTRIGKTFLARAFGHKACRDGFTALFIRAEQLFRELEMGRADGSYGKRLRDFSRVDVLIVDDWAMTPLDDSARRAFLEICDERYQERSTMLTSQLPVSAWHAQIGDPTIADSILDRLVHNAHRIDLQGESIRKLRRKGGEEKDGGAAQ